MAIWMSSDTATVLGDHAQKCLSRSLYMDRLPNLESAKGDRKKDARKMWFERLISIPPVRIKRPPLTNGQPLLYAQLQSRLMVNMAGGVMENAGLCLDRFGLPYIPGSAIKGCARRMAIQRLLEAEAPCEKGELLFQIALIFGWGESDWKAGRKRNHQGGRETAREPISDFWWAMAADSGDQNADSTRDQVWQEVCLLVAEQLDEYFQAGRRAHSGETCIGRSHFGGLVSFLPGVTLDATGAQMPLAPSAPGTLELDVVTCHQPGYYRGDRMTATDDDDPNPVLFPAVAAGHVFAFPVWPLRNCEEELLKLARNWLADGLSTFGIGAKTAAGYGWFNCSEEIQRRMTDYLTRREKQETERRVQEAEAAACRIREEAERKRKEEEKAALGALSPDAQEDYKLNRLTKDQFRSTLDNFERKTPEEQKAIVRAFRLPSNSEGSRREFWDDLKSRAQKKGGKLAKTEQAIRQLSKQMYPGKEGKMP